MNPEHLEELASLDRQHLLSDRQLSDAATQALHPDGSEEQEERIDLGHLDLSGHRDGVRNQVIAYRRDDWELLVVLKDMDDSGVTRLEDQLAIDLAPGQLEELGRFLIDLSRGR